MFKKIAFRMIAGIAVLIAGTFALGFRNVQAAVPTINFSAEENIIPVNTSTNLNWEVVDAVSCDASGAWIGDRIMFGTYNTGNLLNDSTYVLTCVGSEGEIVSSQVTVVVVDPPELNFFADDATIPYNTSTNLNWSTTGATSCTASGDWIGDKETSGTESTGNLISSKDYTLECEGLGGTTTSTVSVVVESPLSTPTLEFSADRYFINYDESVTLQWDSVNTDACLASGDWTGSRDVSGSQNSGNLQSDKHYTLTCVGEGGSVARLITIVVAPQSFDPPELTFTADNYNIEYGDNTTLRWVAVNANSCTALGTFGWDKPVVGDYNTGILYSTRAYTLRCDGDGGSVTQSVTVNVGANPDPPPTLNFSADSAAIPYNTSTDLNWSTTGATSCTASGDWSGDKGTSGTESTGNLTNDRTYVLYCVGSGGSVSKNVTVIVGNPADPPEVNFWADDYSVNYNSGTTLRWTSEHASWCELSYNSSTIDIAFDGNYSTGNLINDTTYALSCGNAAGTTTRALTIVVNMVGSSPIINLWADENPIDYGSSTTVRWTTQFADECQMIGEGGVPTDGSIDTGILYSARTYILQCIGSGGESQESITININAETIPSDPPELLFWADQYMLLEGEDTNLHWIATNADWCTASLGNSGWPGDKPTSGDQNTGALYTTTSYQITCGNIQGEVSSTLTIEIGNNPNVRLNFWADEYVVPANGNTTLRWDSTNANFCYTYGGMWGWWNSRTLDGTEDVGPLLDYSNTYILRCVNFLSSETKAVTVTAGDPPPSVSLYATSYAIGYNTPATLFWDSFNSTHCEVWNNQGEPTWNWSDGAVSGSQITSNLTSNTRFHIRCYGPGGQKTRSVRVRVASPSSEVPQINFWANDYIVASGGSTDVHWTSQDADGCRAFADQEVGWNGNKNTDGDSPVGPFTQNTQLHLVCWNGSGSSSAMLNIAIGESSPLAPSLSFWADSYSFAAGGSTTLRWNALNADECVAQGDWVTTGIKNTVGDESTGTINVPKRYELTCHNDGGEVTGVVEINVGGAPPPVTANITANIFNVGAGSPVTLTWSSQGADNCIGTGDQSGDWPGNPGLSGNRIVTPDYSTDYQLTCTGSGGNAQVHVPVTVSKVIVCPEYSSLNKDRTKQLEAYFIEDAPVDFSCGNLSGATRITDATTPFLTTWSTSDTSVIELQATPGLIKAIEFSTGVVQVCAQYKEILGCAGVEVSLTCWECLPDSTCAPISLPMSSCPAPYFAENSTCLRMCGLKWGSWREVAP